MNLPDKKLSRPNGRADKAVLGGTSRAQAAQSRAGRGITHRQVADARREWTHAIRVTYYTDVVRHLDEVIAVLRKRRADARAMLTRLTCTR